MYQRVVDNEINCGLLGSPESTCPYAFLDHSLGHSDHGLEEDGDHEDHVCFSCPCNAIAFFQISLHLSQVFVHIQTVYVVTHEQLEPLSLRLSSLFRPPKTSILFS
ncbi:hypothetical protein LPTSP4_18530 [Leptospira ryugenii]|uniref:Uncharacterized protein n=1 Tax=Leptospira ryugenii TaxID=1917863 RepID=A0A2P2E0B9_9LEPT|nr:hypothetical protein [Leptospira ryugenii]GBF50328.1 hypothetical protein LPTSP4_18530 [Leptospira ryugenii]